MKVMFMGGPLGGESMEDPGIEVFKTLEFPATDQPYSRLRLSSPPLSAGEEMLRVHLYYRKVPLYGAVLYMHETLVE